MTHDQASVRDVHGDGEFLLDQQHRQPAVTQGFQVVSNQRNNFWCQALGGFVDDDQVWVTHQGAAQGQHLLLAAREHAGLVVLPLFEAGEQAVHVLKRPAALLVASFLPQHQVLVHCQRGENVAVFGHIAQAKFGNLKRLAPQNLSALPVH